MRGMNVLVDCPQSTAGEWRFRLFGVQVGVKFWFWISTLILCGASDTSGVVIWVLACLACVLIHEFGHVLAFRVFGEQADIVLYGWGGLTIPWHSVRGTGRRLGTALAGPAAGFSAAALSAGVATIAGLPVHLGWRLVLPVLQVDAPVAGRLATTPQLHVLLSDLMWINLAWALINLLPVYPLDGSQAAQAIFEHSNPYGGRRKALLLSAITGGLVAALGMMSRSLYMVLAFLVLAVSSAQALESAGHGAPRRPERPWRG
jgi:Zn-dependent protease